MKSGIHLGRPPARTAFPLSIALLAAAGGALVLAVLYLRTRSEVDALSIQVRASEQSLGASGPAPGETPLVATRLRLALDSGATEALPPTELLRLVESALPEGVLLGRLSFNATPQSILTLEATTLSGDRVTEMERRLLALPAVATTSLLEERRLADGTLGVRIQVGLARR